LCSDVLDLQVVEHGPDARLVTVGGEIDPLTAAELAVFVIAQVTAAPLVVAARVRSPPAIGVQLGND
jgi:hypothetical protein